MNIAIELHHRDHTRAVPGRIFSALQHGTLSVRCIPVVVQTAAAVLIQDRFNFVLIVTRQIEQIIQFSARDTQFLDHVRVFDISDAGRKP